MSNIRNIFFDFICLIYPHLCAACNASLAESEHGICTRCRYKLPANSLYEDAENPVSKKFWGRVPFCGATALFEFRKGNKVQKLIHAIKYQQRTDAAQLAGKMLGVKLKEQPAFHGIDAVVPVPMHPKRLRSRGYNQAEIIAAGVCTGYFSGQTKPANGLLMKTRNITSQTKKDRISRISDLCKTYSLNLETGNAYQGAHLLLVDDVITTGATIEACSIQLQKIPGVSISIAALADVNF